MRKLLIPLIFASTSCFAYRSSFDTVPSTGIPRASVSQIESMIVEHEHGPDTLCPHAGLGRRHAKKKAFGIKRFSKKCRQSKKRPASSNRVSSRVWIETTTTPQGGTVYGHYAQLPQGAQCLSS